MPTAPNSICPTALLARLRALGKRCGTTHVRAHDRAQRRNDPSYLKASALRRVHTYVRLCEAHGVTSSDRRMILEVQRQLNNLVASYLRRSA